MPRGTAQHSAIGLSWLPLVAVFVCAAATLVTLVYGYDVQDRQISALAAKARAALAAAQQYQTERDALNWRIEHLGNARDVTQQQLAEKQAELSHVEDHLRRLRDEVDKLRLAAEELEAQQGSRANRTDDTEEELARLQQAIADAEQKLKDQERAAHDQPVTYSVVPYLGPNQTRRRPIYIECRKDSVIIQAEQVVLGEQDFIPPLGPGNPLAAAIRAYTEHLTGAGFVGETTRPYPMLLVRPDGIEAYYAARAALQSWGTEFGYELVGEDWKLEFPPADARLAANLEQVLADARRRQEALAVAAPRQYRRPRTALRASPNGRGFVSEDEYNSGSRYGGSRYSERSEAGFSTRGGGGSGWGTGGVAGGGGGGDRHEQELPYGSLGGGDGQGTPGGGGMAGSEGFADARGGAGGGSFAAGDGRYGSPGNGNGAGGSAPGEPGLGGNGLDSSSMGEPEMLDMSGTTRRGTAPGPTASGPGGVGGNGTASGQAGGGNEFDLAGPPYGGAAGQKAAQGGAMAGSSAGRGSATAGAGQGLRSGANPYEKLGSPGQGYQADRQAGSGNGSAPGTSGAPGQPGAMGQPETAGSAGAAGTAGRGGQPGSGQASGGQAARGQTSNGQAGAAGAAGASGSASGSPGSGGASAMGEAGPPQATLTAQAPQQRPRSLASKRGRDWGLPEGNAQMTPVTRPVIIRCEPTQLIILPEDNRQLPRTIPVPGRTEESVDNLVSQVWDHMKDWGLAGRGMYWRPTLVVEVAPGAEARYTELQALLEGSGMEVKPRQKR